MATFFMFRKCSSEAIKAMSAERAEKSVGLIKKYEGKVNVHVRK